MGYTQLRLRRNRELVARHPRWKHVRPERLTFPPHPTPYERYDTALIDAERHLRQAEELYRTHSGE